jgi:copper transport protein
MLAHYRSDSALGAFVLDWFKFLFPARRGVFALVAATLLAVVFAAGASGHANVERSSPPEDGLLGAPPRTIELWTTERVATGPGSPEIKVLNADGSTEGITVSNVYVDPNDARHIIADVSGIGSGTYTVVWAVLSEDDGHLLNGSYGFRVAGTARAPGAATVEGETPRVWAVATRWLTFLGVALAAAGFLYGQFIQIGGEPAAIRRRTVSILVGGAVALIATLAEPFLQTRFPPEGASKPSLGDAIASLPTAWWLRPIALVAVIVLGAILLAGGQRVSGSLQMLHVAGGAVALVALLGLALTSHASARETWRVVAVPSIILHQWAVALWVGGLAQLTLSWPWGQRSSEQTDGEQAPDPVRMFSRYALGLALVGIGTGVLNAGLVLPTLKSLWQSDYGEFLIAKVAILVPVLALASFNRLKLHRIAVRIGTALRTTVRLEAAIILLVVLCGSILALLAPPTVARGNLKTVDLAATTGSVAATADDLFVRLQVRPARAGDNQLKVLVAHVDGTAIPTDQIALVRLALTSLDHEAAQPEVATTATNDGFVSQGVQLSLDDWWRVDVLIRRLGIEDVSVPFYFRLPDPNVNGFDEDVPEGTAEARAVYERGLAAITSMHSVHFTQRLASGTGTVALAELRVHDGTGTDSPSSSLMGSSFKPALPGTLEAGLPTLYEQVSIGTHRWQRTDGGQWLEGEAAPVFTPDQWGENYTGATGFHLGRTEDVDGKPAQIVTFLVPGTPRLAAAFYSWWVDTETGNVVREAMVSREHYMLYEYRDIDQQPPIAPPT